MTYPKKIMKISELVELGFSATELRSDFRIPGQTFAWKMNPYKSNSHLVFDTEEYEKFRKKRARASQRCATAQEERI